MNVKAMAQSLIDKGYTQTDIVNMCRARGVKTSQPTIHRTLRGNDPRHKLGEAIRRAYMDNCENKRDAA